MHKKYYQVLFFLSLFCICFNVFSQKKIGQDTTSINSEYFTLTLAQLLDMEITIASKTREKVSEAPGMITAYSYKDVDQYGYYTLSDFANITSGYSTSGVQYGEYGFETRGQSAGGFENDKHLVLIDGIPINFARSNKAPIQEELPLFFAKQITFLKGPSSALYGASAFYGVVNITSFDLEETELASIDSKLSLGTLDQNYRAMGRAVVRNEVGTSQVMIGYYTKDASRDFVGDTTDYTLRNWDDNNSLFLYFKQNFEKTALKGFQFGMINMRRRTGLGEHWGGPNSTFNELIWSTLLPYIKYHHSFNNKLSLTSYIKGNLSTEMGKFGGYYSLQAGTSTLTEYRRRTLGVEALAEVNYQWTKNINLIGGVNYEEKLPLTGDNSYLSELSTFDSTSNYSFLQRTDTDKITTLSAFLQAQFDVNFLKGLKVTAGIREDYGFSTGLESKKINDDFNQLSPRLGLVQKMTNKINLKLLVSTALRLPTVKTVGLNSETTTTLNELNTVSNIDDVDAETIQSYEGGITYNEKRINASVTLFSNITGDQIVKGQINSPNGEHLNIVKNLKGKTYAKGYEFDFQYVPNIHFKIGVNNAYAYAYHKSNDLEKEDEVEGFFDRMPLFKTNVMGTYTVSEKFPISITFVGRIVHKLHNGENGNTIFDTNIIVPIVKRIKMEVQVRNILDTQRNDFSYLSVPMAGRHFMFTLSSTF